MKARRSDSVLPAPLPGQPFSCWYRKGREAAMAAEENHRHADRTDGSAVPGGHGGDGAEVSEDQARVIERAAAIDVAKGFGMVCTL